MLNKWDSIKCSAHKSRCSRCLYCQEDVDFPPEAADALHHAEALAAPADVAWGRAAVLHKAKALKRGLGEETRGAEGSPSLHPARLFGPLPWAGISFSVRFVVLL